MGFSGWRIENMSEKKSKTPLIALLCLLVCACGLYFFWQSRKPQPVTGAKAITIEVLDNEEKTTSYELHTDAEYLKDAMDELAAQDSGFSYTGSEGEYGLFIEAVNGITADFDTDKAYWAIYVNDEYGQYGADQQPVSDGDAFRLAYEISTY